MRANGLPSTRFTKFIYKKNGDWLNGEEMNIFCVIIRFLHVFSRSTQAQTYSVAETSFSSLEICAGRLCVCVCAFEILFKSLNNLYEICHFCKKFDLRIDD